MATEKGTEISEEPPQVQHSPWETLRLPCDCFTGLPLPLLSHLPTSLLGLSQDDSPINFLNANLRLSVFPGGLNL